MNPVKFNPISYLGTWYEIAKYPFVWEKDCFNPKAEYSWIDGKLKIKNSCLMETASGYIEYSRKGTGDKLPDDGSGIIKFKIIFDDGLRNDGVGDYWILYTDYKRFSIVGSPSKQFLWVLSRTKFIKKDDYDYLLSIIRHYGYPLEKLKINMIIQS